MIVCNHRRFVHSACFSPFLELKPNPRTASGWCGRVNPIKDQRGANKDFRHSVKHLIMRVVLHTLLLVGVLSRTCLAQDCPLLGPAYPAPTDIVSSALTAAKVKFEEALRSDPRIDRNQISFAVQVYSSSSKTPIHSHYSTAPHLNSSTVGPETLFRIHSISKVLTVYTIISKLGHMYWHEPVTKYVPELAVSRQGDDIRSTDWSEVTLGDLASQMSGISRDCKFTILLDS